MSEDCTPYIEQSPGDLITAESWNRLQCLIQDDIRKTAQEKVDAVESVAHADNADKLEGKSTDELTDDVVKRALAEIRLHSGYLAAFKILKVGEDNVIRHGFNAWPLVDVYQLDYFPVVCCEDKDTFPAWATFYLYHTTEKKIRYPQGTKKATLDIEDGPVYKIRFSEMLERYKVKYTPESSLGDLETEFWKAFFAAPNDEFDDDQVCHSPWFEKCCREENTVKEIERKGDFDDLWFTARPRKTINYPASGSVVTEANLPQPAPTQVQVSQFDLDTVGLRLLGDPIYPQDQISGTEAPGTIVEQFGDDVLHELKVLVLLKC